jgi:hypothetical protein
MMILIERLGTVRCMGKAFEGLVHGIHESWDQRCSA